MSTKAPLSRIEFAKGHSYLARAAIKHGWCPSTAHQQIAWAKNLRGVATADQRLASLPTSEQARRIDAMMTLSHDDRVFKLVSSSDDENSSDYIGHGTSMPGASTSDAAFEGIDMIGVEKNSANISHNSIGASFPTRLAVPLVDTDVPTLNDPMRLFHEALAKDILTDMRKNYITPIAPTTHTPTSMKHPPFAQPYQHSYSENGLERFPFFVDLDFKTCREPRPYDRQLMLLVCRIIQVAARRYHIGCDDKKWKKSIGRMFITCNVPFSEPCTEPCTSPEFLNALVSSLGDDASSVDVHSNASESSTSVPLASQASSKFGLGSIFTGMMRRTTDGVPPPPPLFSTYTSTAPTLSLPVLPPVSPPPLHASSRTTISEHHQHEHAERVARAFKSHGLVHKLTPRVHMASVIADQDNAHVVSDHKPSDRVWRNGYHIYFPKLMVDRTVAIRITRLAVDMLIRHISHNTEICDHTLIPLRPHGCACQPAPLLSPDMLNEHYRTVWLKILDVDVYGKPAVAPKHDPPHLRMTYMHKGLVTCTMCGGAANAQCAQCLGARKILSDHTRIYELAYILHGDGTPDKYHCKYQTLCTVLGMMIPRVIHDKTHPTMACDPSDIDMNTNCNVSQNGLDHAASDGPLRDGCVSAADVMDNLYFSDLTHVPLLFGRIAQEPRGDSYSSRDMDYVAHQMHVIRQRFCALDMGPLEQMHRILFAQSSDTSTRHGAWSLETLQRQMSAAKLLAHHLTPTLITARNNSNAILPTAVELDTSILRSLHPLYRRFVHPNTNDGSTVTDTDSSHISVDIMVYYFSFMLPRRAPLLHLGPASVGDTRNLSTLVVFLQYEPIDLIKWLLDNTCIRVSPARHANNTTWMQCYDPAVAPDIFRERMIHSLKADDREKFWQWCAELRMYFAHGDHAITPSTISTGIAYKHANAVDKTAVARHTSTTHGACSSGISTAAKNAMSLDVSYYLIDNAIQSTIESMLRQISVPREGSADLRSMYFQKDAKDRVRPWRQLCISSIELAPNALVDVQPSSTHRESATRPTLNVSSEYRSLTPSGHTTASTLGYGQSRRHTSNSEDALANASVGTMGGFGHVWNRSRERNLQESQDTMQSSPNELDVLRDSCGTMVNGTRRVDADASGTRSVMVDVRSSIEQQCSTRVSVKRSATNDFNFYTTRLVHESRVPPLKKSKNGDDDADDDGVIHAVSQRPSKLSSQQRPSLKKSPSIHHPQPATHSHSRADRHDATMIDFGRTDDIHPIHPQLLKTVVHANAASTKNIIRSEDAAPILYRKRPLVERHTPNPDVVRAATNRPRLYSDSGMTSASSTAFSSQQPASEWIDESTMDAFEVTPASRGDNPGHLNRTSTMSSEDKTLHAHALQYQPSSQVSIQSHRALSHQFHSSLPAFVRLPAHRRRSSDTSDVSDAGHTMAPQLQRYHDHHGSHSNPSFATQTLQNSGQWSHPASDAASSTSALSAPEPRRSVSLHMPVLSPHTTSVISSRSKTTSLARQWIVHVSSVASRTPLYCNHVKRAHHSSQIYFRLMPDGIYQCCFSSHVHHVGESCCRERPPILVMRWPPESMILICRLFGTDGALGDNMHPFMQATSSVSHPHDHAHDHTWNKMEKTSTVAPRVEEHMYARIRTESSEKAYQTRNRQVAFNILASVRTQDDTLCRGNAI